MNKKQYLVSLFIYLFIQFSSFAIFVVVVVAVWFFLFCLENEASKKTLSFIQTTERIYTVIALHKMENMKSRMAKKYKIEYFPFTHSLGC